MDGTLVRRSYGSTADGSMLPSFDQVVLTNTPGVFYWIIQLASIETPAGGQIIAAKDGTGAAATWYGSVEDVGQSSPVIGIDALALTPNVSYKVAWVHVNVPVNVVVGTFTTETDIVWAPIPVRRQWRKQPQANVRIKEEWWPNIAQIILGEKIFYKDTRIGSFPYSANQSLRLSTQGRSIVTSSITDTTIVIYPNIPPSFKEWGFVVVGKATSFDTGYRNLVYFSNNDANAYYGINSGALYSEALSTSTTGLFNHATGSIDIFSNTNTIGAIAGYFSTSNGVGELWQNGILKNSVSHTYSSTATVQTINIGGKFNTAQSLLSEVSLVILLNYPTSDMIRRLSQDPWQIFAPQTTFASVPVQVSGPTLITVRPSADITTGAWTSTPSGDLYSVIDEVTYSDVDYISTTSASTAEVRLQSVTDPISSSNHTITFRAKGIGGLGLQVKLYQNTTLIATTTPTLTSSFQDFIWTLSGAEADSITDYSDLRVRFVAV